MTLRVLLIDDDKRLAELLLTYLESNDAQATHARAGEEGLLLLTESTFDVVVLDIMMPGLDGLSVLRKIRDKMSVPVIMLTAKGDETDRVVGLELGADDYLTKPFSPRELLARMRAVLRRGHRELEQYYASELTLDQARRSARWAGKKLDLTGLEFDLLLALMQRKGRVVKRQGLMEMVGRDGAHVLDRTMDVHISHLRQKLAQAGGDPQLIRTVRGVGYILSTDDDP